MRFVFRVGLQTPDRAEQSDRPAVGPGTGSWTTVQGLPVRIATWSIRSNTSSAFFAVSSKTTLLSVSAGEGSRRRFYHRYLSPRSEPAPWEQTSAGGSSPKQPLKAQTGPRGDFVVSRARGSDRWRSACGSYFISFIELNENLFLLSSNV